MTVKGDRASNDRTPDLYRNRNFSDKFETSSFQREFCPISNMIRVSLNFSNGRLSLVDVSHFVDFLYRTIKCSSLVLLCQSYVLKFFSFFVYFKLRRTHWIIGSYLKLRKWLFVYTTVLCIPELWMADYSECTILVPFRNFKIVDHGLLLYGLLLFNIFFFPFGI